MTEYFNLEFVALLKIRFPSGHLTAVTPPVWTKQRTHKSTTSQQPTVIHLMKNPQRCDIKKCSNICSIMFAVSY